MVMRFKTEKPEAIMDNFLSVLGLWRKPVARDGYCLFRAVSEQIYFTQTYHQKLYELAKHYFHEWNKEEDGYFWSEYDVMLTLSRIFRRDFLIYETPGRPSINITKNGYDKKIVLCRLEENHLDCVYTKGYMQDAAVCQSIIYEILYRGVFKLDKELDEAVKLIRDQNKNKPEFGRPSPSNSPDSETSVSSTSTSSSSDGKESKPRDYKDSCKCVKKVTPPLPYRIAKALDPLIYRNTELDIWEEERREAIHREKYSSFIFSTGDKCQVILDHGPIYHGHIQKLSTDREFAIVYVEELGEKKEVPLSCLKPSKSTLRTDWYHRQQLRKQRSIMPSAAFALQPPPLIPKMSLVNNSPGAINGMNGKHSIQSNGDTNSQLSSPLPAPFAASPFLSHMPPPPLMPPPLPQNGSLPMMSNPMMPLLQKTAYNGSPPNVQIPVNMMSSQEVVTTSGSNQMYPCILVPFMDSIALRQVNVNNPPSEDPAGKDLPGTDTNTLRFFFNLGVEYYRSVSNMSMSMSNGGAQNQVPVVFCQSKNEVTTTYTAQAYDSVTLHDPSLLPSTGDTECQTSPCHELDDKRSNASIDSGCESDQATGAVIGSPGNNSTVKDHNYHPSNVASIDNGLEKITACSDMSISDSADHESILNDQELSTVKTSKPRRKYYMYGNLKLIKPIKDIPKRFLNMLAATSAERQRCEGEPIILASPTCPENQKMNGQSLVPGYLSKQGTPNSLVEGGNGLNIPDSVSSSACQTFHHHAFIDKSSSTNTSCTRTPFYAGYSFPPPQGTVYFCQDQHGIPQTYNTYPGPSIACNSQ